MSDAARSEADGDAGNRTPREPSERTEADRRRIRTLAYLRMWAVEADVSAVPVVESANVGVRSIADIVGRAKSLCLVALKGQGLTQHEVFAFADAYAVWDALTVEENDFVLEPAPERPELVQYAWKYEGLWVLEWALGAVRHLAFPDAPCDHAEAARRFIASIVMAEAPLAVRPMKELLDAADVARCLDAVSLSLRANPVEGAERHLHHGVVHERGSVFRWMVREV